MVDAFYRLKAFLNERGTAFRLTEHAPEGRTDLASALRGHALADSAKSMVVQVRTPGHADRYFLAVVPGHRRVDFKRIEQITGGKKASLAPAELAGALTGCVMGAVPPFSFHPDLTPLVDPDLFSRTQVVFNAARLECSIWLTGVDFAALATPHAAIIAGNELIAA